MMPRIVTLFLDQAKTFDYLEESAVRCIYNEWLISKISILPLYHTHEEIKIEFINKSVDADSRPFLRRSLKGTGVRDVGRMPI